MKKTIIVASFLLLVVAFFNSVPQNLPSTVVHGTIKACFKDNCMSCSGCLTCPTTFKLLDSTGAVIDSCICGGTGPTCCTFTSMVNHAGTYHLSLSNICFTNCIGSNFTFDGMNDITYTFDCSTCSGMKKKR